MFPNFFPLKSSIFAGEIIEVSSAGHPRRKGRGLAPSGDGARLCGCREHDPDQGTGSSEGESDVIRIRRFFYEFFRMRIVITILYNTYIYIFIYTYIYIYICMYIHLYYTCVHRMQITSAFMACPQELRLLETPETEEQQVHRGDVLKGHPIHGKFTIFSFAIMGHLYLTKKVRYTLQKHFHTFFAGFL